MIVELALAADAWRYVLVSLNNLRRRYMGELKPSTTWNMLHTLLRNEAKDLSDDRMDDIFEMQSRIEGFLEKTPAAHPYLQILSERIEAMRIARRANLHADVDKAREAALNACGRLNQFVLDYERG
jgi:hypothetical protein